MRPILFRLDPQNSVTKSLPWKPEDVVFSESASTFRISPDGRWAVWVKSVADKEDRRSLALLLTAARERLGQCTCKQISPKDRPLHRFYGVYA